MTSKNFLLSLILLLGLALSWWLIRNNFEIHNSIAANQPNTPDQYMLQMDYTRFNSLGKLQDKIYAVKIIHFQNQDSSLLTQPRLLSYTNEYNWDITADHGTSINGNEQILLKDHVIIKRLTVADNSLMVIKTSSLTAYPYKQMALTNQPVTVEQPDSIINSVGMIANLKTGNIKFLSKTKGIYQSSQ